MQFNFVQYSTYPVQHHLSSTSMRVCVIYKYLAFSHLGLRKTCIYKYISQYVLYVLLVSHTHTFYIL